MNPINGTFFFNYKGGRRFLSVFEGDQNQLRFFWSLREMIFIYITMISTPAINKIGTFLFFDQPYCCMCTPIRWLYRLSWECRFYVFFENFLFYLAIKTIFFWDVNIGFDQSDNSYRDEVQNKVKVYKSISKKIATPSPPRQGCIWSAVIGVELYTCFGMKVHTGISIAIHIQICVLVEHFHLHLGFSDKAENLTRFGL